MSKTEQIIEKWKKAPFASTQEGKAIEGMIHELRRLAKLNEAYWAEIEARRNRREPDSKTGQRLVWATKEATDAARREAGEV